MGVYELNFFIGESLVAALELKLGGIPVFLVIHDI